MGRNFGMYYLNNLILDVVGGIGDSGNAVGHRSFPPRNGEKELVIHSDINRNKYGIRHHIIDESLSKSNIDMIKRKSEGSQPAINRELGSQYVDQGKK